jgi:two-component system, OmpR family, sensor histidine kinase ArlS
MKITTKINFLITAWVVFILLLVNTIVFYSFMKTTVNMEQHLLSQKAHDILNKSNISDINNLDEEMLQSNLTSHSYIRIVGTDSKIVHQVSNDRQLIKIKPKFSKQEKAVSKAFNEHQNIVVRVPILSNQQIIGTLEIGQMLSGLESRKDILLSILATVTVISVILSLIAGRWLSNIIMKPVTSLISTMENIEQSGVPQKIVIQKETKDELQKMATTFNKMIEKLRENSEKQRRFISDASHELKTPLTVIGSFANLLRRRGVKNEEMAKEAIEAIYTEANRMKNMTQTLLDLAESEHLENVQMKTVDLVSLCQGTTLQLNKVYKRDITLQTELSSVLIRGNELKIKQLIIIFLDNAIKYSTGKIDVFINKYKNTAILSIKDYGIGIPKEELDRIFERFYRVDKARSRETGGTGLGLSIAKIIIALHKGEITIDSKEDEGTEIKVCFPLASS